MIVSFQDYTEEADEFIHGFLNSIYTKSILKRTFFEAITPIRKKLLNNIELTEQERLTSLGRLAALKDLLKRLYDLTEDGKVPEEFLAWFE